MTFWMHIMISPFSAFFMAMLWAAMFGDTIVYWKEKSMIEEFVVCIQIYFGMVLIYKLKNKLKK